MADKPKPTGAQIAMMVGGGVAGAVVNLLIFGTVGGLIGGAIIGLGVALGGSPYFKAVNEWKQAEAARKSSDG